MSAALPLRQAVLDRRSATRARVATLVWRSPDDCYETLQPGFLASEGGAIDAPERIAKGGCSVIDDRDECIAFWSVARVADE